MAARPLGSKNKQRSQEKMAELRVRREQRRALKAAVKNKDGVGNNAAALSDDQLRALHYIHVGEYEAAQAAVKKAMATRKTVIARIKSEGGVLDQIKVSIELQDPDGEERVVADIQRRSQAARWAGVGLQLDLFDQDRADAQRQYELGKTAGLKGVTPTTQDQDWLTGWHAGQEALSATLDLFRSEPRKVEDKDEEFTQPARYDATEREPAEMIGDMSGTFPEEPPTDLTEGETENLADIEGAAV